MDRRRLGTFSARYTVIISDIDCTISVANPGKAQNNRVITDTMFLAKRSENMQVKDRGVIAIIRRCFFTSTLSIKKCEGFNFFVVFVDLSPMATQSDGSLYVCLKFERNH